MKQRDIKELHTKTTDELRTMVKELKESVVTARMDQSQQKLANTSSLRNMKTDIARVLTVLNVKAMQEQSQVTSTEGSKA